MAGEKDSYRAPLWAEEIDYVRLEEQLNQLLADPAIRKRQTASAKYIEEKLRERMKKRHAQVLDQASRLDKQELCRLVQQNMQQIGLSQRMFREFRNTVYGKEGLSEAMKFLEAVLLEKEMLRFQKEAGIPTKVWKNFIFSRIYTGEATLRKIRRQLALTPEEIQEFDRTIVANVFEVNKPLKEDVHKLRKATGMSVSDFLAYACVSADAWESFYPVPKDAEEEEKGEKEEAKRKTSQKTLLKLIIGYRLSEQKAKAFLAHVNSAFVMRLDLVFLTGIRCEYNHPMEMQQILDFFSEDQNGEPFYPNPYR